MKVMTHTPNTARTALVSTTAEWMPITDETPTGMKCLVIDKAQGIAYLREYWPGHGWTHYFPLPRFKIEYQVLDNEEFL